jgi:DNA-nicking Smr family endonuclease
VLPVRSLSPEEAALWARVTATIRPLSRELKSSLERGGEPPKAVEGRQRPVPRPLHHRATRDGPPPSSREERHSEKTLDGSWDKKLLSGSVDPDRVLDLHGMNLDAAWMAIDRSLGLAIARGERVLLLITGHHRPGEPPVQRGKIRAAVHDWLAASRHAADIAAVRGAHRRHGGGGSLYLILRRKPPRR